MVVLNDTEKGELCQVLAQQLPKLRELLGLSQAEFSKRCGISTARLSVIENGHHSMSWTQLCAVLFVCACNRRTKEYLYANAFLDMRLLQFLQQKEENIPPETNIAVDPSLMDIYVNNFHHVRKAQLEPDNKTIYTPAVQMERIKILDNTSHDVLFEYLPKEDLFRLSYMSQGQGLTRNEFSKYLQTSVFNETVHPDFAEQYRERLLEASQKPTDASFEYLTRIGHSGYRWHRLSYRSVADANGKIRNVYGRSENINTIVKERETAIEQAIEKASTDLLTGIYNKVAFMEKVTERLSERRNDPCALVMVDLDNFKAINDENGHIIGDNYLIWVSRTLLDTFTDNDLIGRFGGDEFVVYAENVTVDRLRDKIRDFQSRLTVFPEEFKKTCSIGAYFCTDADVTVDFLIGRADAVMYRVKKTGKDGYALDT